MLVSRTRLRSVQLLSTLYKKSSSLRGRRSKGKEKGIPFKRLPRRLEIKRQKPHVSKIYLRSDEAGRYHNNFLIAAVKDFGQRMGKDVCHYDYSEPQYGKDVCDRILCPMKSCIRRFCNEGHDILTAADMKGALSERPVIGTITWVCAVDETRKTLEMKKMEGFNRPTQFPVRGKKHTCLEIIRERSW